MVTVGLATPSGSTVADTGWRLLQVLIQRVDYEGAAKEAAIFRPARGSVA